MKVIQLTVANTALFGSLCLVASIFFLDTCSLAAQVTQVIELCAADLAAADNIDVIDDRCVQRENALDTDAEADLSYCDRFTRTAVLAGDDNAFKNLKALLIRLLDADVHLDGVARLKSRNVFS